MREPRWVKIGSYTVLIIAAHHRGAAGHLGLRQQLQDRERGLLDPGRVHRSAAASRFANYELLLTRGDFQQWFINSCHGRVAVTVIGVFLAATAAYAPVALSSSAVAARRCTSSWWRRCSPASSCSCPLFNIFTSPGPHRPPARRWSSPTRTIAIPFSVLMLKAYFDTIPFDLEEAGMVDGLGRLRRVLAHRPAALGSGCRGHRLLQLHHGLERVHARERLPGQPRQPHPAGRPVHLHRSLQPALASAGRGFGDHLDPGDGLLLRGPALPHLRACRPAASRADEALVRGSGR